MQAHETARRPQGTSLDSARAQRHHQFATFIVAKTFEIERGITLVAQEFDQGRPSFFHGRLNLALGDPHEVHLERLGEEVFSVAAIRTRQ
jgi:hypothetical protein